MVGKMLGVADIAAMFGVAPKTVSMWRLRYTDFPEPDVVIGDVAGWDPSRAEELQAWEGRRPGRGRRTVQAEHVQETMRRIFVYRFMRPDDFAWAPIHFPGVKYKQDGRLADGMQAEAATYLVETICSQGYELVFEDQATDIAKAMQHVLWDPWTEDEIGNQQFVGPLFDDYGRIYRGCTAFDAASYALQRLEALGGEVRSVRS